MRPILLRSAFWLGAMMASIAAAGATATEMGPQPRSELRASSLQTSNTPIIRVGRRDVTGTFDCPEDADFIELLEERTASGDDDKLVVCLKEVALRKGYERTRQWIEATGYEGVTFISPPSVPPRNELISIAAKNRGHWYSFLPLTATSHATVSLGWREGQLWTVMLGYTRK